MIIRFALIVSQPIPITVNEPMQTNVQNIQTMHKLFKITNHLPPTIIHQLGRLHSQGARELRVNRRPSALAAAPCHGEVSISQKLVVSRTFDGLFVLRFISKLNLRYVRLEVGTLGLSGTRAWFGKCCKNQFIALVSFVVAWGIDFQWFLEASGAVFPKLHL